MAKCSARPVHYSWDADLLHSHVAGKKEHTNFYPKTRIFTMTSVHGASFCPQHCFHTSILPFLLARLRPSSPSTVHCYSSDQHRGVSSFQAGCGLESHLSPLVLWWANAPTTWIVSSEEYPGGRLGRPCPTTCKPHAWGVGPSMCTERVQAIANPSKGPGGAIAFISCKDKATFAMAPKSMLGGSGRKRLGWMAVILALLQGALAQTTTCGDQGLVCQNGGECITTGSGTSREYSCRCPTNWINGKTYRGRQCETESVECDGGVWCVNNGAECGARPVDWAHGDGQEDCELDGGECKPFGEWSFGVPQAGQRLFYLCEGGSRNGTFCNSAPGCSCPTGFTGRHCEQLSSEASSDQSTPCGPSGLVCHNGGSCRQRGSGDADYYCHCNTDWVNGRTFRGLQCELETLECGGGVWCSNNGATCSARDVVWAHGDGHEDCESGGGECKSYTAGWSFGHPQPGHGGLWLCEGGSMNGDFCNSATGCSCPDGYTGRHCDVRLSESQSLGSDSSSGSNSLSGGAIAGIVISAIVASVAVVVVLVMYRKERTGKPLFLPFEDENIESAKPRF